MTIDGRRRKAIRTIGQVSSLVDRARGLRALARVHNMTQTAKHLTVIANTLDGVRTHLVEDHEYEPIAAAFVDTASKRLVQLTQNGRS